MLTFWPVLLYGLGIIVGAGVYVAIGAVIERAGNAAPFSFIVAGVAAGLTGLCYAELAARVPEAAGAAAYVRRGFGSNSLGFVVGVGTTVAVALAAASIARGAASYLGELLPVPGSLLVACLVVSFTVIAVSGVRSSVALAASISVVELGGLLAATVAGLRIAPELSFAAILPSSIDALHGVITGAFIAFFAFIGFETLANMAEEVREPSRTLPRAILGAIGASIVLYVAVAWAAVLSGKGAANPLLGVFAGRGASVFAVVAFLSVANGVLIEIVMLSRLFYGMACNNQLPAFLGKVHPATGTPILATVVSGTIVLVAAITMSFEGLLVWANALTLTIFPLVDVALWRLQSHDRPQGALSLPRWVPLAGAAVSISLVAAQFA